MRLFGYRRGWWWGSHVCGGMLNYLPTRLSGYIDEGDGGGCR